MGDDVENMRRAHRRLIRWANVELAVYGIGCLGVIVVGVVAGVLVALML